MPPLVVKILVFLAITSFLPLAIIYRARAVRSPEPRIHPVWHMDNQGRFKAQQANPFFADGRASRLPPAGTVRRLPAGEPGYGDTAFHDGKDSSGAFVTEIPAAALPLVEGRAQVTPEFLERGRQRYEITCAPCHASTGDGQGLVHRRAMALITSEQMPGGWVPPANLADDRIRALPAGQLYDVIRNGKSPAPGLKTMPGYGAQVATTDRWAIVAWLRVLGAAGSATLDEVPADVRPVIQAELAASEAAIQARKERDAARKAEYDRQQQQGETPK